MTHVSITVGDGERRKRNFFNDETLSDVIVRFADKQIFAHKVILVSGSLWFEKALLGNFSEANKKVIELRDDTNPEAMMAMLKYLYDMDYCKDIFSADHLTQTMLHLEVYILGEKYDMDSMRVEAARQIELLLSEEYVEGTFSDSSIFTIQMLLGPNAIRLANRSLQIRIKKDVLGYARVLLDDETFRDLFAKSEMFDTETAMAFLEKVNELWDLE